MSDESLIEAVKQGDAKKVEELIEGAADANMHGSEQEWTPLNFAAGQGNLEMVKLLVDVGKADVFKVGRDSRTPYKIAIAAGHAEVAHYLAAKEAEAGGDKSKTSSRESESRPYCKAYPLRDMRQFQGWLESRINWKEQDASEGEQDGSDKQFSDDDVVFLHQDFTVTQSMFHNENVIMQEVTSEWKAFCTDVLGFKVPDDFDLMPSKASEASPQDN